MRYVWMMVLMLLLAGTAAAHGRTLPWPAVLPGNVERVTEGARWEGGELVVRRRTEADPEEICVLEWEGEVPGEHIALRGHLSNSSASWAHATMWAEFPDGKKYFSTVQFRRGGGWTEAFELPMHSSRMKARRLTLWVKMGVGEVRLSPVTLGEAGAGAAPSTGWWSGRLGGWIGGIGGTLLGVVGGMVGWLTARKRFWLARGLALGAMAVSAMFLAGGIAALVLRQPYAVYYTCLLLGLLGVLIMPAVLWTIARERRGAELRRMEALDA